MAKARSALDHLKSDRKPHVVHMIPPGAPGHREANGGSMVVSSPAEVDALVRGIGPGEVATLDDLRAALSRRHGTATACPVSTAIFAGMSARAAEEMRQAGMPRDELTPWWRLLKRGGFLNPKLPGGVERQRALLEAEGVRVTTLRRHMVVVDHEALLPSRPLETIKT